MSITRRVKLLFLVASAFAILGVSAYRAPAAAGQAASPAPKAAAPAKAQAPAPAAAKSPSGEGVFRSTLKNGLRVVIVPDKLAPVATTVMNYLVGSNEAPDGFPGMAHAEEHMMFRGSPNLTA